MVCTQRLWHDGTAFCLLVYRMDLWFNRTTRQLMLTPFGTALLPYINDMLDRNEQLNNFIADYKHEKRGRINKLESLPG